MKILVCIVLFLFSLGPVAEAQSEMAGSRRINPEFGKPGVRRNATALFHDPAFLSTLRDNTKRRFPALLKSTRAAKREVNPSLKVGDKDTFFVTNFVDVSYSRITAEARYVDSLVAIFVDSAEWANHRIVQDQVDSIAEYLVKHSLIISRDPNKGMLENVKEVFGDPPDIDGDGRLNVLLYDIQDGYTPGGAYISGYFSWVDQTDQDGSNHTDILYLDIYPTIYGSPVNGIWRALATTAHEYQHLIHYGHDPNEILFINEGLSMNAELVCGFTGESPYGYFKNTNVPLLAWPVNPDSPIDDYSRAQYFFLYLKDRFGEGIFRAIVGDVEKGFLSLGNVFSQLSPKLTVDSIFIDWAIANQVQNRSIARRWGYKFPIAPYYPLPNRTFGVTNVSRVTDTLAALSASYCAFSNVGPFLVRFTGETSLQVCAVSYTGTKTTVSFLPMDTWVKFDAVYRSVVFIIVNRNHSSSQVVSYEARDNSESSEIAYDRGVPDTLVVDNRKYAYLTLGNDVCPGSGMAVSFVPVPNSTLVTARLMIAFDQELPGSNTPPDAQRDFIFHLWKSSVGVPADNIIQPIPVTVNRAKTPQGSFVDVSLAPWSNVLFNRSDTLYAGFTDDDNIASALGLVQVPDGGMSHSALFTGPRWPDLREGLKKNTWYSFNDISFGQNPVPLRNWDLMVRTVWQKPLVGIDGETPVRFALDPVYPNPYSAGRGNLSVPFTLRRKARVSLAVFDVRGRKVAEIASGSYPRGSYVATWEGRSDNGRFVPAGTYIVRLLTANYSSSRLVLVMR